MSYEEDDEDLFKDLYGDDSKKEQPASGAAGKKGVAGAGDAQLQNILTNIGETSHKIAADGASTRAVDSRAPPQAIDGSAAEVRMDPRTGAPAVTSGGGGSGGGVGAMPMMNPMQHMMGMGGGSTDASSVPISAIPTSASIPSDNFRSGSPMIKEDGKMFIGGLNWETTDESLKEYFTQYGEVSECTVMRDGSTGRSRGFGFLTFRDPKCVNVVMVKEHFLDGKIIDPKRAIPRDEQERTSKIFVGGVSQDTNEESFRDYFTQFGRVIDATLMIDKDTGRPRGFGFVTFDSDGPVETIMQQPYLSMNEKQIEVKRAQPKGNVRDRMTAGFDAPQQNFQQQPQQNQNYNYNGMSPAMMAQYWQRMQTYWAAMQQQMAGGGAGAGRGMQMNPMMMQMMQQQQQAGGMMNPNAGGGGFDQQQYEDGQAGEEGEGGSESAGKAGGEMSPSGYDSPDQARYGNVPPNAPTGPKGPRGRGTPRGGGGGGGRGQYSRGRGGAIYGGFQGRGNHRDRPY